MVTFNLAFSQIPSLGLTAYYPFCGNTNDVSGGGQNLHVYGGATLHADRHGVLNACYQFNGVDGMMYLDTVLPYAGDFTYNLWLNLYSTQNSSIIYNGNSNLNGLGLVVGDGFGGPGQILSILYGNIGTYVNQTISLNQWHFITFRKTGATLDMFIDTINVGSTSGTFNTPVGKFHLGLDYTDSTNPVNGAMDDVALYNRAITDREIGQIYLTTCSGTGLFTTQPNSVTDLPGKTKTFSVSTGTYIPVYQWQKNSGSSWVNLTNTAPYSGVYTNTLTVSPTSHSLNGTNYRCVLTNGICCSDTSIPATLTVISTAVNNLNNTSSVSIYPNPATGLITVEMDNNSKGTIQLINTIGQTIKTEKISGAKTQIDISGLPNGIYIVKLALGDKSVFYNKIIKE
jgi:hypothetical protein